MGGLIDRVKKMGRAAVKSRNAATSDSWRQKGNKAFSIDPGEDSPISPDLGRTLDSVSLYIDTSSDLKVRRFRIAGRPVAVAYIEEVVDKERLESGVLLPLLQSEHCESADSVLRLAVPSADGTTLASIHDIVWAVLDSKCVVIAEGWQEALAFDVRGGDKRSVSEPAAEVTVKGPRQGFVEDIATNLAMIRRKIKHPSLRLVTLTIGNLSRTKVVVLYLNRVARPDVVAEAVSRLRRIDIDSVEDTGYLIEFIEDAPLSPFPQIGTTERPDRVTSELSSGRIAILVDGSPFAMLLPYSAISFLQSPDDYYERWTLALITRLIRVASVLISMLFPAVYLALTTFHQELIPRSLALTVAVQREQIPYPVVTECLILLTVFEIVTEASVRLPRAMGQTIGIVGTLVIGESAVRANLTSNVTVIVVALTAVAQFTVTPEFTTTIRLLRVPVLILGSILGLYGVFAAIILILLHVASLRSFGLPYLYPYAPLSMRAMTDATIRLPWWSHVYRPELFTGERQVRIAPGQEPEPPADPGDRLELEIPQKRRDLRSGSPSTKNTPKNAPGRRQQ